MTLSSDISTTSTALSDIKNAIIAKGQTPTGNITTYATAISNIQTGSSEIPSYQVTNGVLDRKSKVLTGNEFSNITSISDYGLSYAFYGCTGLTGDLDLSSLTTVSGKKGLYYAFYGCTGLTSVDLSSLTTISGDSGLDTAFYDCTGLTSVDLSSLTTISGDSGLNSAFRNCTGLTSVDLSSLATVSGSSGLGYTFRGCTGLTSVSFPALKTSSFGYDLNQFQNMLSGTGTNVTHTLHFPSNMESTISRLMGYPLFGGTSGYVTVSFDLPATS